VDRQRRQEAGARFWIAPDGAFPLDVARGPAGHQPFRIHLKRAWAGSETANIYTVVYGTTRPSGYACAFNSQGGHRDSHAGGRAHRAGISSIFYPAIYKGSERPPEQLSYFHS